MQIQGGTGINVRLNTSAAWFRPAFESREVHSWSMVTTTAELREISGAPSAFRRPVLDRLSSAYASDALNTSDPSWDATVSAIEGYLPYGQRNSSTAAIELRVGGIGLSHWLDGRDLVVFIDGVACEITQSSHNHVIVAMPPAAFFNSLSH